MSQLKPIQLGNSGLRVSRLCLGTMNFGQPGRGHQGDWTLDRDRALPIFKAALDRGLFYFDCADVYGLGATGYYLSDYCKQTYCQDMNNVVEKGNSTKHQKKIGDSVLYLFNCI